MNDYDVGVIEVTTMNESGKKRIRTAFEFLLRAIRESFVLAAIDAFFTVQAVTGSQHTYRNPASPSVLTSPAPWDVSRSSSATPTASFTNNSPLLPPPSIRSSRLPPPLEDPLRTPRTPLSPSRTRSMSDLLAERGPDWDGASPPTGGTVGDLSRDSSHTALSTSGETPGSFDEPHEPVQSVASRES